MLWQKDCGQGKSVLLAVSVLLRKLSQPVWIGYLLREILDLVQNADHHLFQNLLRFVNLG